MFTQKFPFGKFRNVELHKVDTPYLVYALENFELSDELRHDISKVVFHKLRAHEYFSEFISDMAYDSKLIDLDGYLSKFKTIDNKISNVDRIYIKDLKPY